MLYAGFWLLDAGYLGRGGTGGRRADDKTTDGGGQKEEGGRFSHPYGIVLQGRSIGQTDIPVKSGLRRFMGCMGFMR